MGLSYEVDALNRLVVKKGRKSKLKKFRQVIRGRFKVDRKNRLYYEVHKSPHKDVPQKIKFSGNYSLDKKGNLTFTLTKSSRKYRSNKLRLRTKLLNVDGKEIVLLAGSRTPRGKRTFYIIKLYGKWDSDKFNRLTFGVDRGGNKKDTLTLFGAWKVNKSNEIVYRVGRDFRQVIFKGNWEIQDRYILRYVIDKKRNSGFHFTSSLGQIIPKKKKVYIKFDIGIDISKRKRITRKIIFTSRCRLGKGRKIILELVRGKKTSLKIKKEILNKGSIAYIESLVGGRERYLGAGVVFGW